MTTSTKKGGYQHFRVTYFLHLQGRSNNPE